MTPDQAVALVRPAADALSRGDVEGALALAPASRCSLEDLQRVLREHPIPLLPFTDADYENAAVDQFYNDQTGECGFYVLLEFTARQGGYGDLCLIMIVASADCDCRVGVDDLLNP